MNKLGIKLILFFTVLACIGPFFLKDKNGQPLLSWKKVKMPQFSTPDMPSIKDSVMPVTGKEELAPGSIVPSPGQAVVKMYTYKDSKGVIHYTDQKPQGAYKVMYMPMSMRKSESSDERRERLDGEKKDRHDNSKAKSGQSADGKVDEDLAAANVYGNLLKKGKTGSSSKSSGSSKSGDDSLPNPYKDPGKLIEDAKAAKKLMDENYANQKKAMDELNKR